MIGKPFLIAISLLVWYSISFSESMLDKARDLAEEKNYKAAHHVIDSLLVEDSAHVDGLLLKGLIYSWQKSNDSARLYLHKVIQLAPDYRDAWQALINSWKWEGGNDSLHQTLNNALAVFPADTAFLRQRSDVTDRQQKETVEKRKSYLAFGDRIEFFTMKPNRDPWQIAHLELNLPFKMITSVTRISGAKRSYGMDITGYGATVSEDFYIHPIKGFSVELFGAYSPYTIASVDTVLPQFKIGGGVNVDIASLFEVGLRADFRNYGDLNSYFFALDLNKYLKKMYLSLSNHFAPDGSTLYYSGTASLRWYWSDDERNYFALKGGAGKAPLGEGDLGSGEFIFLMGRIENVIIIKRNYGVFVGFELAKEQFGFNETYIRTALEAAFRVYW